jgi:hypothetical protein
MTSRIEAKGRCGKQDFVYLSDEDVYRCPAGEKLGYYYTNEENGRPRVARAAGSLSAPSRRILGRAPHLLQDRDRKNMLETAVVCAPARSRLADTPSRALSRSQDPFQTFDVTASRIFVPDKLS